MYAVRPDSIDQRSTHHASCLVNSMRHPLQKRLLIWHKLSISVINTACKGLAAVQCTACVLPCTMHCWTARHNVHQLASCLEASWSIMWASIRESFSLMDPLLVRERCSAMPAWGPMPCGLGPFSCPMCSKISATTSAPFVGSLHARTESVPAWRCCSAHDCIAMSCLSA